MPRPRTIASAARLLIAPAVLALALAGCGADTEGAADGGPGAEQQVRAVVARFGIATRAKDYQQICDRLLADELVQKIESVGLPCESALQRGLGDVRNPTLQINEVSISGGRALVSVHSTATGQPPSDDALQLVRQDGDWKIAALAAPGATRTQTQTTATTETTTTPAATTPASTGTTTTSRHGTSKKKATRKTATTKKGKGG